MAKAPKPGTVDKGPDDRRRKRTGTFRMRLGATTLEMPTAIPFKERFAVRAATGLPLEQFWRGEFKIDLDSLLIIWWLIRRYNGEPHLSLDEVEDTWPDDLEPGDIKFEVIEDDGEPTDDPESSGPG